MRQQAGIEEGNHFVAGIGWRDISLQELGEGIISLLGLARKSIHYWDWRGNHFTARIGEGIISLLGLGREIISLKC